MKKNIVYIGSIFAGLFLFAACQVEGGYGGESLTDSGRDAYHQTEGSLREAMELFENSLRLDEEIRKETGEGESGYFPGETVFKDRDGWWGVMNWNGCHFKVLGLNGKSFSEEGASWIAQSKYSANDSIVVECLESNRWTLKGYVVNYNNQRTIIEMEISTTDMGSYSTLDSVAYYVDVKGMTVYEQHYPPRTLEITFVADLPLLREKRAAGSYYAFMEGRMKIGVKDQGSEQKQQFVVQLESLPLNERMVKVTAGGNTEIY